MALGLDQHRPAPLPRRLQTSNSTSSSPDCNPTTTAAAQTGVLLAEILGWPHATIIIRH